DWVRELMGNVDRDPARRVTEQDLRDRDLDPTRVRRYFRKHYGMTFHAYLRARRMGLALARVREGGDLLAVGLDHGFESASGFRDAFARLFGTPPATQRERERERERGGERAGCLLARRLSTPLGRMLAIASERGLVMLEFTDRRGLEREILALRR